MTKDTESQTAKKSNRTLSVQLDPVLKRKLTKIARSQQRSVSFLIRAAAEQYIASQEADAA